MQLQGCYAALLRCVKALIRFKMREDSFKVSINTLLVMTIPSAYEIGLDILEPK